jgi:hypothetical protein
MRKWLKAATTIVRVTLIFLAAFVAGYPARVAAFAHVQSFTVPARAGEVFRLDGEVWVCLNGNQSHQPLRVGQRLSPGDVVLTGADGRVEWSLNPNSYFQVGPRSQVRVFGTALEYMHFDVERGEVFVIADRIADRMALEIDTRHKLLTVMRRGSYRVRVAANNDTEATVVSGELQFMNDDGKAVRVRKHQQVRFLVPEQ